MIQKIKITVVCMLMALLSKIVSAQNPCGTPDVLSFGSITTYNSADVSWNAIAGATAYNVEYRVRNIGAAYSSPAAASSNSFTITNLSPSTNYEFIVQSVCGTDTSSYSSSGWFTTPANGANAALTRGPYMTSATKNSIIIQWNTDINCNSEIHFGTNAGNLNQVVSVAGSRTHHDVQLNNLLPNTKYYYSIGVIGTSIQGTTSNYFYTAPEDNDTIPLKFWVTGDFGTGTSAQTAVRNSFANFTAGQKINGWLWLGDNAYTNGLDQEYQNKVFNVYPNQFKNIPLFPALGNHDYAQSGYQSSASLGTNFPYFDIFDLPQASGTEKYYSVNYGNVHLIALDSYGSYNAANSAMYNWLEADLSNNTKQWTIVYFHHPPYSKGSHDSDNSTELVDMRNNIIPLLESNGVDLVLSGHSHAYERSFFIKGHYGNEASFNSGFKVQPGGGPYSKTTRTGEGTVYVVCGVSGQTSATTSGFPHNAMYYSSATELGSLVLEIGQTSLTSKFVTSNETIADQFTITKQSSVINSVSSQNAENKNATFNVYPNPAKDQFNVVANGFNERSFELNIYNLFGQVILKKSIEAANKNDVIRINKSEMNNCASGMYFISLSDVKNTITKQIVLE